MSNPIWLITAASDIGITELAGPQSNRLIEEYHKTTGIEAATDSVAWCSSFVNYHIINAGLSGTNSKLARSWLNWGKPLVEPRRGCIVILRRGNEPWQGHVGFFIRETPKSVVILGGNQNNKVGVDFYSKSRVLGYRWPTILEGNYAHY